MICRNFVAFEIGEETKNAILEGSLNPSPVTQIFHYHEGEPRSYTVFPLLYRHPMSNDKFLLYCPVGYNNHHWSPPESHAVRQLTEEQKESALGGGWDQPELLFFKHQTGVELPSDYDPKTSTHVKINSGIQQPHEEYDFYQPQEIQTQVTQLSQGFNRGKTTQEPDLTIRQDDRIIAIAYLRTRKIVPSNQMKQISPAELQWQLADRDDQSRGITPPPRARKTDNTPAPLQERRI